MSNTWKSSQNYSKRIKLINIEMWDLKKQFTYLFPLFNTLFSINKAQPIASVFSGSQLRIILSPRVYLETFFVSTTGGDKSCYWLLGCWSHRWCLISCNAQGKPRYISFHSFFPAIVFIHMHNNVLSTTACPDLKRNRVTVGILYLFIEYLYEHYSVIKIEKITISSDH